MLIHAKQLVAATRNSGKRPRTELPIPPATRHTNATNSLNWPKNLKISSNPATSLCAERTTRIQAREHDKTMAKKEGAAKATPSLSHSVSPKTSLGWQAYRHRRQQVHPHRHQQGSHLEREELSLQFQEAIRQKWRDRHQQQQRQREARGAKQAQHQERCQLRPEPTNRRSVLHGS